MRHTWLQVPRKRWEIFTQVSLFIAEYHSHLTYVWAQSDRLDHASFGWGGVGHVEHNSNVYSPLKQFGSNSLRHISATNNRKMEHLVWRLSSIYSNEWPVFNSGQMRSSASLNKQEEKPCNTWERGVNKQKPFRKWTETRLTYPKQKGKKGKKKETTYWGNIQQLWLHLFSITAIQKDSQVLLFLVLGS